MAAATDGHGNNPFLRPRTDTDVADILAASNPFAALLGDSATDEAEDEFLDVQEFASNPFVHGIAEAEREQGKHIDRTKSDLVLRVAVEDLLAELDDFEDFSDSDDDAEFPFGFGDEDLDGEPGLESGTDSEVDDFYSDDEGDYVEIDGLIYEYLGDETEAEEDSPAGIAPIAEEDEDEEEGGGDGEGEYIDVRRVEDLRPTATAPGATAPAKEGEYIDVRRAPAAAQVPTEGGYVEVRRAGAEEPPAEASASVGYVEIIKGDAAPSRVSEVAENGVWLLKKAEHVGKDQRRYFVLQDNRFRYYASTLGGKPDPSAEKGHIPLSPESKVSLSGVAVRIANLDRVWQLEAETAVEAARWVARLNTAARLDARALDLQRTAAASKPHPAKAPAAAAAAQPAPSPASAPAPAPAPAKTPEPSPAPAPAKEPAAAPGSILKGVWLLKKPERFGKDQRRYFVLEGAEFKYYTNVGQDGGGAELKGSIQLSRSSQISTRDGTLVVENPDRVWKLQSAEPDVANAWAGKLSAARSTEEFRDRTNSNKPRGFKASLQFFKGQSSEELPVYPGQAHDKRKAKIESDAPTPTRTPSSSGMRVFRRPQAMSSPSSSSSSLPTPAATGKSPEPQPEPAAPATEKKPAPPAQPEAAVEPEAAPGPVSVKAMIAMHRQRFGSLGRMVRKSTTAGTHASRAPPPSSRAAAASPKPAPVPVKSTSPLKSTTPPAKPSPALTPAKASPAPAYLGGPVTARGGLAIPAEQPGFRMRRLSSRRATNSRKNTGSTRRRKADGSVSRKRGEGSVSRNRMNSIRDRTLSTSIKRGAGGAAPTPMSKSDERAVAAAKWVDKEVRKLIAQIKSIGTTTNGKTVTTYGELFKSSDQIFEALSGTLKTARSKKVVAYDSEVLFQGVHDHVAITLLKEEIADSSLETYTFRQVRRCSFRNSKRKGKAFGGASLQTSQSKCHVCGKTVYPMEFVGAADKAFHKACFRCHDCKCKLTATTYCNANNLFFCRVHYDQNFKKGGDYDKGFGG